MLSANVKLSDVSSPLIYDTDTARFGSSSIQRFKSSVISLTVVDSPKECRLLVSEPHWPRTWLRDASSENLARFPCQAIEIAIAKAGDPGLVITRSAAVGAPLYVAATGDSLVASWQFEEAVACMPAPRPDVEACCLYLREGPPLTRDQVIKGVYMLWPGESVRFSGDGLIFTCDNHRDVAVSSVLVDDARATDALVQAIGAALDPLLATARNPMLEISGGLDSACTAVAAATLRSGLSSYGLIHEGAVGVQQRNRRGELISLLKLDDFEYPSNAPSLFAALAHGENQVTPFDDNHRLPCVFAVDNHHAENVDLVISGIGGDELAMAYTYLRKDWQLPGTACVSSLTSSAQRYDMFMRRGIWVANPLTAQSVVDLCRALPDSLRTNRMFNRLLLARAGLSDGFLFPRLSEHYGNGMQHEAALFDFDLALSESIVADLRIIDISPLLREARQATNGGFSYKLIMDLFWLLKLEAILRRYVS